MYDNSIFPLWLSIILRFILWLYGNLIFPLWFLKIEFNLHSVWRRRLSDSFNHRLIQSINEAIISYSWSPLIVTVGLCWSLLNTWMSLSGVVSLLQVSFLWYLSVLTMWRDLVSVRYSILSLISELRELVPPPGLLLADLPRSQQGDSTPLLRLYQYLVRPPYFNSRPSVVSFKYTSWWRANSLSR